MHSSNLYRKHYSSQRFGTVDSVFEDGFETDQKRRTFHEVPLGNVASSSRQFDIPYAGPKWFTIPKHVQGRLMADDFVYFEGGDIDRNNYQVVVESLDVAGTPYRSIGTLKDTVKLPFVIFSPTAKIALIPNSTHHPRFVSTLVRGATYIIPKTNGKRGTFIMERLGGKY